MPRNNSNLTYKQTKQLILDMAYPIGTYYLSEKNTNPSEFLGGSWIEMPSGTFLLASSVDNSGNTNKFYINEENIKTITSTNAIGTTSGKAGRIGVWNNSTIPSPYHENILSYENETANLHSTGSGATGEYYSTLKVDISSHQHKIGQDTPTNLDLTNIIKHPICYIFKRIA